MVSMQNNCRDIWNIVLDLNKELGSAFLSQFPLLNCDKDKPKYSTVTKVKRAIDVSQRVIPFPETKVVQ